MVRGIEGFEPDFQTLLFTHGKGPADSEIHIEISRTDERKHTGIAECTNRVRLKSRRTEPLQGARVPHIGIADDIRPIEADSGHRIVDPGQRRESRAAMDATEWARSASRSGDNAPLGCR